MFANAEMLSAHIPTPFGDVDWGLLILLARTEAAMTWPDLPQPEGLDPSLPNGLDLRHAGDFDWVSRVVALSD